MTNTVLLKPSITPESPETVTLVDDQTAMFTPQFGRGWTQRNSFGDPRWRLKRRYKGMRAADVAHLLATLGEAQGAFKSVLVTPAAVIRGTFPNDELWANNDFASGSSGWTVGSELTTVAADGVLRVKRVTNLLQNTMLTKAATTTRYLPYVARFFVSAAQWNSLMHAYERTSAGALLTAGVSVSIPDTLVSYAFVMRDTNGYAALREEVWTAGTRMAGDFIDISWCSLSQCFLVDNEPNKLLQSEVFGTTWTVSANSLVVSDQAASPTGTVTADYLRENSVTNIEHYVQQTVSGAVTSAAQDVSFSVSVKTVTRGFAAIRMIESTGSSQTYVFVNLSTGALTNVSNGANWTDARATAVDQGDGWWRVSLTSRKTNAATQISCLVSSATVAGTFTYVGVVGQDAIAIWGGSLAQSGVPVGYTSTTTAATTGTAQTGGTLNVKGLPVSTNGLLLAGDFVEINQELKQLTATLNSDAAGLGVMQFRPGMHVAPADGDAVVVNAPLGRFSLVGGVEWQTMYGSYMEADLTLDEVNS